ncbi:MAG: methyltransferase family protein [Anaerolineae bacterium]
MDTYLTAYIALVFLYRVAELAVMTRTGTIAKKPRRDWTAWLIIVPYWLVLVAPPLEYMARDYRRPSVPSLALGVLLFAAATYVRVRAHLDLGKQFSMFLEEGKEEGLVTTGLYGKIRHPLYLGNLLLFLACPTFLGVAWSWILTLVGIVGVVVRIEMEERFLRRTFEGYDAYTEETSRLIPGIY